LGCFFESLAKLPLRVLVGGCGHNFEQAAVVTFTRGLAVMERVHRDPARLKHSAAALVEALPNVNKR
jgi:hypothetical protein